MEEIKLSTGLKKIAIKDEDGEIMAILSVDVADSETAEKFANVINKLNDISANCEADAAKWRERHKDDVKTEEINVDLALEINRIRVKYLKQIVDSLNGLFGKDALKQIYGDIVPDELAIVEFVEQIVPVMNQLFGKRFEQVKKKYNSGRRGAK